MAGDQADLDLRPERRDKLIGKLLAALQGWVPGSRAKLRGSLEAGTADDYSDIDICWVVPDQAFTEAVETLGAALSQVHRSPVASHRSGVRPFGEAAGCLHPHMAHAVVLAGGH
jgi:hypothetical protein